MASSSSLAGLLLSQKSAISSFAFFASAFALSSFALLSQSLGTCQESCSIAPCSIWDACKGPAAATALASVSMNPFKVLTCIKSFKCSWDGRAVLQSVERLDVSIGRFVRVSDMHCARASPAIAVLDGFLYAIGGFDGNDWLSDVSP